MRPVLESLLPTSSRSIHTAYYGGIPRFWVSVTFGAEHMCFCMHMLHAVECPARVPALPGSAGSWLSVGTYRNPLLSVRTVKYHWLDWSTSNQTVAWCQLVLLTAADRHRFRMIRVRAFFVSFLLVQIIKPETLWHDDAQLRLESRQLAHNLLRTTHNLNYQLMAMLGLFSAASDTSTYNNHCL